MSEYLVLRSELKGHNGWVTAIATGASSDLVISASRDKSLIVWDTQSGLPKRRLVGHNHFVQDVDITTDGKHAISGSWDGSLRLWDLATGASKLRFVGHKKDVLTVAFSPDNRKILSGSRDNTIKLWNTLGHCVVTYEKEKGHHDWVSAVRFAPTQANDTFVSAGWDKVVKVIDHVTGAQKFALTGHTGYINTVAVSPDGSLCASGGKDGSALLWDISNGTRLASFAANDVIYSLAFSPIRYWLCAAAGSNVIVWDIENRVITEQYNAFADVEVGKKTVPHLCTCIAWSQDGSVLYAGYTDGVIRALAISKE